MLKIHTLNDRLCPHTDNAAHGVEIPPGARILFNNGQVGARRDGTVPDDPGEQFEVTTPLRRCSWSGRSPGPGVEAEVEVVAAKAG